MDQSKKFIDSYSDEIQNLCEDIGLSFSEVWFLGSDNYSSIPSEISPIFSFEDDYVTRGDEKRASDPYRDYLVKFYGGKCVFCGVNEPQIKARAKKGNKRRKLELDHFLVPFSSNGQLIMGRDNYDDNIPILSNCVVACPNCNSSKGNKNVAEFLKDDHDLLFKILERNAELTLDLRQVFKSKKAISESDSLEILLDKLEINKDEIENELERRYPGGSFQIDIDFSPIGSCVIDAKEIFGHDLAIGYRFQILWHGVLPFDGNESPTIDNYVEGIPCGDPFTAAHSLKDEWKNWLEENPVEDEDDEEYPDPD